MLSPGKKGVLFHTHIKEEIRRAILIFRVDGKKSIKLNIGKIFLKKVKAGNKRPGGR